MTTINRSNSELEEVYIHSLACDIGNSSTKLGSVQSTRKDLQNPVFQILQGKDTISATSSSEAWVAPTADGGLAVLERKGKACFHLYSLKTLLLASSPEQVPKTLTTQLQQEGVSLEKDPSGWLRVRFEQCTDTIDNLFTQWFRHVLDKFISDLPTEKKFYLLPTTVIVVTLPIATHYKRAAILDLVKNVCNKQLQITHQLTVLTFNDVLMNGILLQGGSSTWSAQTWSRAFAADAATAAINQKLADSCFRCLPEPVSAMAGVFDEPLGTDEEKNVTMAMVDMGSGTTDISQTTINSNTGEYIIKQGYADVSYMCTGTQFDDHVMKESVRALNKKLKALTVELFTPPKTTETTETTKTRKTRNTTKTTTEATTNVDNRIVLHLTPEQAWSFKEAMCSYYKNMQQQQQQQKKKNLRKVRMSKDSPDGCRAWVSLLQKADIVPDPKHKAQIGKLSEEDLQLPYGDVEKILTGGPGFKGCKPLVELRECMRRLATELKKQEAEAEAAGEGAGAEQTKKLWEIRVVGGAAAYPGVKEVIKEASDRFEMVKVVDPRMCIAKGSCSLGGKEAVLELRRKLGVMTDSDNVGLGFSAPKFTFTQLQMECDVGFLLTGTSRVGIGYRGTGRPAPADEDHDEVSRKMERSVLYMVAQQLHHDLEVNKGLKEEEEILSVIMQKADIVEDCVRTAAGMFRAASAAATAALPVQEEQWVDTVAIVEQAALASAEVTKAFNTLLEVGWQQAADKSDEEVRQLNTLAESLEVQVVYAVLVMARATVGAIARLARRAAVGAEAGMAELADLAKDAQRVLGRHEVKEDEDMDKQGKKELSALETALLGRLHVTPPADELRVVDSSDVTAKVVAAVVALATEQGLQPKAAEVEAAQLQELEDAAAASGRTAKKIGATAQDDIIVGEWLELLHFKDDKLPSDKVDVAYTMEVANVVKKESESVVVYKPIEVVYGPDLCGHPLVRVEHKVMLGITDPSVSDETPFYLSSQVLPGAAGPYVKLGMPFIEKNKKKVAIKDVQAKLGSNIQQSQELEDDGEDGEGGSSMTAAGNRHRQNRQMGAEENVLVHTKLASKIYPSLLDGADLV